MTVHAPAFSRTPAAEKHHPQFPQLDVVAARKPLDRAGPCMCAVLSSSVGFGRHAGPQLTTLK